MAHTSFAAAAATPTSGPKLGLGTVAQRGRQLAGTGGPLVAGPAGAGPSLEAAGPGAGPMPGCCGAGAACAAHTPAISNPPARVAPAIRRPVCHTECRISHLLRRLAACILSGLRGPACPRQPGREMHISRSVV